MSSGLQRGTVGLVPYDLTWPQDFEHERQLLAATFGDAAAAIEHVGSTAIPGLSAKPIIDIEVGLHNFSAWPEFVTRLQANGYTFMQDRVRPEEVFMPKGPEASRTHYLHITQFDSPEWRHTLTFRDKLRANDTLRQQYQELKAQLAMQFPDDRKAYTTGKTTFIQRNMLS